MKTNSHIIIFALFFALFLLILDNSIVYLFHNDNYTWLELFTTHLSHSDLFRRLLLFIGFILFGFIVTERLDNLIIKNELLKKQLIITTPHYDSNFFSGFSHQIRTPLNAIAGFSELLKTKNLSEESRELYIKLINSSCNFLLLLINNSNDIEKIEYEKMPVIQNECNLNNLLEESLHVFELAIEDNNKQDISLILKKGTEDPDYIIMTDPEKLKQILHNLLENALNRCNKGMIEFGYNLPEKSVIEFFVQDTGSGYSMDMLKSVFKGDGKFYSIENHSYDENLLRFFISNKIVKKIGGDIRAESKIGEGTTIFFTIPKIEDERHIDAPEKKKIPGTDIPDWSDKTVLIAEDVESNCIYLQEILKRTKINVIIASNGKEAVEHVKNNNTIDIVLMDIIMPEMDGYEALREIRKISPGIPVIAQTALLFEKNDKNSESGKFDGFLTKPIWFPQLSSCMEQFL